MSDEDTLNQGQTVGVEGAANEAETGASEENVPQEPGDANDGPTSTRVGPNIDNPAAIKSPNSPLCQEQTANAEEATLNQDDTTVASGESKGNGEQANLGPTDTFAKQKIDNPDATIESQLNVNSVGKFNYFSAKETTFDDPTTILPEKSLDFDVNLQGELEKHVVQLEKERIILIDSLEENISLAVSYAIAESPELNDYEKRLLTFSGENRDRTDLHVGIFTHEKIKTSSREKLLVFVSLNLDSQSFFDSMFIKDRLDVDRIKQTFRETRIKLVCIVNSDFIRETLQTKQTQFCFHQWDIWFLPHLLKSYFSESEAKYFEKKISEQRTYRLWAEDDAEFYKLVHGYLRNNVEQFREEIEKRTKYCEGDDVNAFLQSLKTVKPSELLKDEKPIKKVILYVATFFSDLSPHDFEKIVSLLLGKMTTTVYKEPRKETQNDVEKTVETPVEKSLVEIWIDTSRQLLNECYLRTVSSEKGSLIIDFSEPYLRCELKRYFKQEDFFYTQRQFERLRDAGLLFDFEVSDKVIENFIALSAEMAYTDPNYYGGDRLVNIVLELKQQTLTARQEREIIIRLSDFIREMLNYSQLKEMIRHFLENLMQAQHHDLVLIIVLGVTKRLRFASQFDALYWIKRLLNQGQKEIKDQAYQILFEHAKQSGFRIYELLETLKTWLPEPERNVKKYSLSNQYTLQFIVGYCGYILTRLDLKEYGQWPSKYPLFATLKKDHDESMNKLKLLVSWIFHPGMQYVLDKALREEYLVDLSINVNGLRAGFIDFWFTILYGLKKDTVHPEALAISEMLLQQIQQVISKTYDSKERKRIKKELLEHLQIRRDMCLDEIGRTEQQTQKAQLKFKRKLLSMLKNKLK